LADMTPEQLEEIPGIGEKTLEKISVAVRHYFGHFEEGEAEPPTPDAVVDTAEAEAENAQETLEEIASVEAVKTEDDQLGLDTVNENPAEELGTEINEDVTKDGEEGA